MTAAKGARILTTGMYSLLIVDDEEEIRNALALYFPWNDWGFEVVHVAEDGAQALAFIRSGQPDVALCDIRMPAMSGLELARRVHQESLDVRVVFLSAYQDFSYAQEAIRYSVRRYVIKPVKYRELEEVFAALRQELDAAGRPRGARRSGFHERVVEEIRGYVERNFQSATLQAAAAHVRMNPNYLSTYYKERTGENFGGLLLRVRMEAAARLLLDVRCRVQEVSAQIGYTSPKSFARAFKTYFGRSPREYREAPGEMPPARPPDPAAP